MTRNVCALYGNPRGGYPKSYARYSIPTLSQEQIEQKYQTSGPIDFKLSPMLIKDFIRVHRERQMTWSVTRGLERVNKEDFKIKFYAVSYARALSCALHLALYIDDSFGYPVEQSAASLTYPKKLE